MSHQGVSEVPEIGFTPQPDWFNLSEPEQAEHTYWSCYGQLLKPANMKVKDSIVHGKPEGRWASLYHSQEEAEAMASMHQKWTEVSEENDRE